MKKHLLGLFAASALMLASCSQDDFAPVANDGKATVSVSLQLQNGLSSRAFGQGTTAQTLKYTVYDVTDADNPAWLGTDYTKENETINIKTNVKFQLANGRTYGMVFWACCDDAPYTVEFSEAGATMTVNYDGIMANTDALDAFYAYKEVKVAGNGSVDVELTRPFAQINFGTNDFAAAEKANHKPVQSMVAVSNVFTTLDLISGKVSDEITEDVEFSLYDIPEKYNPETITGEKFPVVGYDYLAMVFALVDDEQSLVTVEATHVDGNNNSDAVKVSNVPVRRNYRTNIYGALLTSTEDANVEIKPGFGEPDYDQEVVNVPDGKAVMNDVIYETLEAAMAALKEAGNTEATIYLGAGEYTVPAADEFGSTADVKFAGQGDETVFTLPNHRDFGNKTVSLTFEKMKIVHTYATGDYNETYGSRWTRINGLTYKNCTVEGSMHLLVNSGKTAKFEGCTFTTAQSSSYNGYCINYYAYSGSTVEIVDCEFNAICKGILLYGEKDAGELNLNVDNSKFFASGEGRTPDTAAIEIHTENGGLYGTVNINNTTAEGFYTNNEGKGLWAEILNQGKEPYPPTYYFTIYVDGKLVHAPASVGINGQSYDSLSDALSNVKDGESITLGFGEYDLNGVNWPKNMTFTIKGNGAENTKITNIEDGNAMHADGSTINLSDLSLKVLVRGTSHTSMGFRNITAANFENVDFIGEFHAFDGDVKFSNCKFIYDAVSQTNYNLWCESEGKTIVDGCYFDCKQKAILVYGGESAAQGSRKAGDIDFNNCTVVASENCDKAVVEIHSEKYNATGIITITGMTYPQDKYSDKGLWREVFNNTPQSGSKFSQGEDTSFYTIIVDNDQQQTATSDGKKS